MPNLSAAQLERLAGEIKQLGRDLGFSKLGVASIDLEADEARLERWLALGRHGSMHYMERHGRKRTRPAELVPGTVRVVSARMSYWPDATRARRSPIRRRATSLATRSAATITRCYEETCSAWRTRSRSASESSVIASSSTVRPC